MPFERALMVMVLLLFSYRRRRSSRRGVRHRPARFRLNDLICSGGVQRVVVPIQIARYSPTTAAMTWTGLNRGLTAVENRLQSPLHRQYILGTPFPGVFESQLVVGQP